MDKIIPEFEDNLYVENFQFSLKKKNIHFDTAQAVYFKVNILYLYGFHNFKKK